MAITPDLPASRASRWQFSLRTLMAGVTAFAVLLGIGFWLGPATALGIPAAGSLGLLGFAAYAGRRRLARASGILLLLFGILLGLYRYGPSSDEWSACEVCGMFHHERAWLGITWYDEPIESDLSRWYRERQLPTHAHRWRFLSSRVHHWGGDWEATSTFGIFLYPLDEVRDASEQVDEAAFQRLAAAYVSLREGKSDTKDYHAVYAEIMGDRAEAEPDP